MDDTPFIRFTDVQKTYDGVTLIIKHLNLDIVRGEFLTMLGPSGSGKTTCLMLLAGFETPTRGDVFLDGQLMNTVPPHKRGIGMVFQNYALFPHMTVYENLAFPLRVRKMDKATITDKVARALDMVELTNLGDRHPSQLSGGQQQRVALARALVFEPELILMDEPLSALDKALREQMQYEIKHLHDKLGMTVVYVTHDQGEALTISDRIAVFEDGVIQQLAPPNELYEQPANAFVAQFIGENNRLPGKIKSVSNGICTVALETGATVHAQAVKVDKPGMRTMLSIRPERIWISADGTHPENNPADPEQHQMPQNQLKGAITEIAYHGDHVRIIIQTELSEEFVVKLPSIYDREKINRNRPITIGWNTQDCRALDYQDS
ncbi:MAG: ABC transporter ATP-binding protein [Parvularculales bacterium]